MNNYDIWIEWKTTEKCNLNCKYCSMGIAQTKNLKIEKIQIDKLLKTLKRTNKIFKICFTGGEPLLIPNIVEATEKVTRDHYMSMVTNLISGKIKEICNRVDPQKVHWINATLHIDELERSDLVDKFMDNLVYCRDHNFHMNPVMVGHPDFMSRFNKYKNMLHKEGYKIDILPFFGYHKEKKYPEGYSEEELEVFDISSEHLEGEKRFFRKGKLCNVGYNVVIADEKGDIYSCYNILEKLGNLYNEIKLKNGIVKCPAEFCSCPVSLFDDYLFQRALLEREMVFEQFELLPGYGFKYKEV